MRSAHPFVRGLIVAACAFTALTLWIRTSPDPEYLTAGDVAVIESYTLHATHGHASLGPYSRFGWNHPGPLYFYLLAAIYASTGLRTTALFIGAAALNAIGVIVALWTAAVVARRSFALALGGLMALFTYRAADSVASPWNPHVLPIAMIAYLVVAAAVLSGATRFVVWLAVLATFLIQTHLGTAPTVLDVGIIAVVGGWFVSRDRKSTLRSIGLAAAVSVALWALPLAQELRDGPGNLSGIAGFALEHREAEHSLGDAFVLWADLLASVVRPAFQVPWGGATPLDRSGASAPIALAIVALVALGTWQAWRERHAFQRAMGVVLLLASAVSLWSVAHLTGDLFHYTVWWIAGVGVLNCAFALDLIVAAAGSTVLVMPRRSTTIACVVLGIVALAPVLLQMKDVLADPHGRLPQGLVALRLADEVSDYIRRHPEAGKPLLRMDVESWPMGAAIVVRLQKTGVPFGVERDWLSMFTEAVAPDGGERWTIHVVGPKRMSEFAGIPPERMIAERARNWVYVDPTTPVFEPRR